MTPEWLEFAACGGSAFNDDFDPEDDPFYPSNGDYAKAKGICASCLVRVQCGEAALNQEYGTNRHGMRGRMTPEDRFNLNRNRKRTATRPAIAVPAEESQHRMDLYERGWSDIRIAAEVGVTANSIRSWRIRNNLVSKQPNAAIGMRAERESMYRNGATDREIAIATKSHPKDVAKWRARKGYPPNKDQVSA